MNLHCEDLGPHTLYSCPRWLEVLALGGRRADIQVMNRPGGPVLGLLPLHRVSPTANSRYAIARLLRGLPDMHHAQWAFAGPMSAYQMEIPVLSDATEHASTQLLHQAHALAEGRCLLVPYVTDRCVTALHPDVLRHRLLEDFDCWIETPAEDLDAWVATLPAKRRRNLRDDLKRFAAAHLTSTVLPLLDHVQVFARLVSNSSAKHGNTQDESQMVGHLSAIASVFDTDAVLYSALDRAGMLVGAMLGIFHCGELYMRMSGFDYDGVRGSAAYFVVSYYEPLRQRPAHRYSRVHQGTGGLATKRLHGATLYPLWTLVLGLDLTWEQVERANRVRASEILPEAG